MIIGTAGETHCRGTAWLDVHQYIDRLVDRPGIQTRVIETADRRIRKSCAREFLARSFQFVRLQPGDPACDN